MIKKSHMKRDLQVEGISGMNTNQAKDRVREKTGESQNMPMVRTVSIWHKDTWCDDYVHNKNRVNRSFKIGISPNLGGHWPTSTVPQKTQISPKYLSSSEDSVGFYVEAAVQSPYIYSLHCTGKNRYYRVETT